MPTKAQVLESPVQEIRSWIRDSDKTVLIAIRGTKTYEDLLINAYIPSSSLLSTSRWARLSNFLTKLYSILGKKYTYYITGHSLGGALVTEALLHFPWLSESRVYNCAVEPITPNILPKEIKVYNSEDFLYKNYGSEQRPIEIVQGEISPDLASFVKYKLLAHNMNSLQEHEKIVSNESGFSKSNDDNDEDSEIEEEELKEFS
jgi:hypothetical protein